MKKGYLPWTYFCIYRLLFYILYVQLRVMFEVVSSILQISLEIERDKKNYWKSLFSSQNLFNNKDYSENKSKVNLWPNTVSWLLDLRYTSTPRSKNGALVNPLSKSLTNFMTYDKVVLSITVDGQESYS